MPEALRSIRVHGQGSDKYDNVRLGLTARLDTMQAAILIEKLKIFDDEIAARNKVADRYAEGLADVVTVPRLADGCTSVWAQYTIRLPKGTDRDGFAAALKAQGIPTAIYYPKSMHQQTAYRDFPGRRWRPAGQRTPVRRRDQPADARLSRRADAGEGHRGRARRDFSLIPLPRFTSPRLGRGRSDLEESLLGQFLPGHPSRRPPVAGSSDEVVTRGAKPNPRGEEARKRRLEP